MMARRSNTPRLARKDSEAHNSQIKAMNHLLEELGISFFLYSIPHHVHVVEAFLSQPHTIHTHVILPGTP
jgi:hypothetical protein